MNSWTSYPSVFALGHRAIADLLLDPVIVEEKLDGSQCSFGRFTDYPIADGYRVRSKGAELNLSAPDKMFAAAVNVIMGLPLHEGWTYRAEYLMKPKHHTMAYDRIPRNCLAIFDITIGPETYLPYDAKVEEAARLGLEVVPCIFQGIIQDVNQFRAWLDTISFLGGGPIEGLVVKNYARFGPDKKAMMGKFVSERFKETHKGEWRKANPTGQDIIDRLTVSFRSPARWQKAAQHLQEAGQLEGSPRDIGKLILEVPTDVEKEEAEEIKALLWDWAWPKIRRGLTRGLPEWYKEELLKRQFEDHLEEKEEVIVQEELSESQHDHP